jgi:hypothetical protein
MARVLGLRFAHSTRWNSADLKSELGGLVLSRHAGWAACKLQEHCAKREASERRVVRRGCVSVKTIALKRSLVEEYMVDNRQYRKSTIASQHSIVKTK